MAVGLLTSSARGAIVLALDTATPAVTAGIVRRLDSAGHVDVLAERVTVDARAHAERITPNVLEALAEAGLTVADLDAVVVGCGPGPFTGLRVGMATAAAYGHALGIPVHGVCSLDAIGVRTAGDTLVVTDARRREVYWARYRDGIRIEGPAVNAPADVDPGTAQAVAGSPEHAALFDLPRREPIYPTAAGLIAAVADWSVDPSPLVPLYLRRPDAKSLVERGQPVILDALTVADAARCAQLEACLFPGDDPWPAAAFGRELAAKYTHYVAARTADTLVGYAGISRLGRKPPFEYEVHTIGVDPAYQGQGIGRRLLAKLLDFADGGVVYLEVRTDNAAAIALYRGAGFVKVGLR
ncbi:MAG: tRNA (adenosine(37)-N6)-threonylcarbamoyltransferase complex dimerization subunit type 1 TsaB, partial [Mycobacterium sp.]|nr:tRNA (adenosine(37)-N6)-threonylcarbamoyltransferase complex dimerization subunit type 1 TsaB [Mycobacterium sp.]